ncbi:MAG TPA: hypothetical protein VGU90_09280 [Terriglobales bacterium]|nr:hypothetical protein [Terriglobales bacterium]
MANLESALQQLREERRRAEEQAEKLGKAILAIEGILGRHSTNGSRASRVVSAAARRRMARAQRARWARVRQSGSARKGNVTAFSGKRRTLSAAARRKIAAAQRARWARFRAKQVKAAA